MDRQENKRKVMCFGTFDILHVGHLSYFKQAKQHGECLIVVIARDKTKQDQKKELVFDEQERLELIQNLSLVDEVVFGNHDDHFKIILEKKPDVVCLGYDHLITEAEVKERLRKFGLTPEVIRAKPYMIEQHKSTTIKEKMLRNF